MFRTSYDSTNLFVPTEFRLENGSSPTLTPSAGPSCPLALNGSVNDTVATNFSAFTNTNSQADVSERVLPALFAARLS
jgi:hypothetical protein